MFLIQWWRVYRARQKTIAEMNTIEWKRENLNRYCPYTGNHIFKFKCTVTGLACTAFDCYVDLPAPKDGTEQAEYLD